MADQPVDQQQALEQISRLRPPERALCEGLALWLSGRSLAKAAKQAGCPPTTLRDRIKAAGFTDYDRSKLPALAEAQAAHLAEEASRLLMERMGENGEDLTAMELNVIWGTATDKITRLATTTRSEADGARIASVIAQISQSLAGSTVSLRIEPGPETVDVTPTNTTTSE